MTTYGKGICTICGKEFIKTAPNKKFCSNKCNPWIASNGKKRGRKKNKDSVLPELPELPESPKLNIFENELENEFTFLIQLRDIAKSVFRMMQISRLEKFSMGTQEMAKELMVKTQKHLNKELNGGMLDYDL